jgi:hypothetical protein
MRFISIFTHTPNEQPPTAAEMEAMGQLCAEGMKEGWLLATEGVSFGESGFRVHKNPSGISIVDGPFAESKEVLGGYALLKAGSKAEVIELTRRFLNATDNGTCEIYQLYEMPVDG